MLTAIDWVFELEKEAIILEDDTLPSAAFYEYCDEALTRYRRERSVQQVGGYNPLGPALNFQPFVRRHLVSSRMDCWGWATWSDRWHEFRQQSSALPGPPPGTVPKRMLKEIKNGHDQATEGKLDSWAYSWAWFGLSMGRVSIVPLANLVSNLGFGPVATHTRTGRSARVAGRPKKRGLPFPPAPDRFFDSASSTHRLLSRVLFRSGKRWKKARSAAHHAYSVLLADVNSWGRN